MGRKQEIERYQSGFTAGMHNALEIIEKGGNAEDIKNSIRERANWKVGPIPDEVLTDMFTTATKMAIVSQGIITCAALHDLFGFGEQRLRRVMEHVEKGAHYVQKGWLSYFDMVEELKNSAKYEALVIEENKAAFGKYWRPDLEDTWQPADFIDPQVYAAMLRNLEMYEKIDEDGNHDLHFKDGRVFFSWSTPWEQVQAFDVLCGIFSQRVYEMLPPTADVSKTIQSAMARTDPFGLIREELRLMEKEQSSQTQNKSLGSQESGTKPQKPKPHRAKKRRKR